MKTNHIDYFLQTDKQTVYNQIESLSIHYTNKLKEFTQSQNEFIMNKQVIPIFSDYKSLLTDFKNYIEYQISICINKQDRAELNKYNYMLDSNFNLTNAMAILTLRSINPL